MLHEFVIGNRQEIVKRCKARAAQRLGHAVSKDTHDRTVPWFLDQFAGQLLSDRNRNPLAKPAQLEWLELRQATTLHTAEFFKSFVSVEQVVYEYGDICQSVTKLADEQQVAISAREFGILNLCLDRAIADAVSAFGSARERLVSDRANDLHARIEQFGSEHERMLDVAAKALAALRTGSVGMNGPTANLLAQSLDELGWLVKHSLPEMRLGLAKTTVG